MDVAIEHEGGDMISKDFQRLKAPQDADCAWLADMNGRQASHIQWLTAPDLKTGNLVQVFELDRA